MPAHLHPANIENPQEGDQLAYRGGQWVNFAPRIALSQIYDSTLEPTLTAEARDTNNADQLYLWENALSTSGFIHNQANGRFIAQKDLTVQVRLSIRVTNATANNRAMFYAVIDHRDAADALLENYRSASVYVRDDNPAYDKALAEVITNIGMSAGDYLEARTIRLYSQDPGDDNPASITGSHFSLWAWGIE